MDTIDVSQGLEDEPEDAFDESARKSLLPQANISLKPKAYFENLRVTRKLLCAHLQLN